MTKRVAILHYASPPTVGGVESTMEHHARGLSKVGYAVRVVSGAGASFDPGIETSHIDPLFGSTYPDILRIKAELDAGQISPAFHALVERITEGLREALAGCDACIVHNVLTLNKNLPLTVALKRLSDAHEIRLIAWCHDLAWTNPQYQPELHPGEPWNLLRVAWPGVKYVTVSESRRFELADLLGIPSESIDVIPPGVDPARFFRWTPAIDKVVNQLKLLDADGLFLLPARLTRRKNIALALHVLAAIREQSACDFRLIVTGPPGPHNPTNPGYLGELLDLRRQLHLENAAHFLYELGTSDVPFIPDGDTIADLYRLADALLFPSAQEGFGIPILEAGLSGLPIFCADIPPFRATGEDDVTYFDPVNEPAETIASRVLVVLQANPTFRLRGRVRRAYRWDVLIHEKIVPLLEA